jgi:inhibitor of cysteine peptidase
MMNKYAILSLALIFSLTGLVFANSICDTAPCEKMIGASVGKDFTISLQSNPSTGFEWWVQFDPQYLSLENASYVSGQASPGMVGVPGMMSFIFAPKISGETHVVMLHLQPWENGTIGDRKIYPITIT